MNEGVIFIWIACAVGGWAIGNSKGRAGAGLALGLLLGFIGVIIALVMKPDPSRQQPQYNQGFPRQMQGSPVNDGSQGSPTAPTTPAGWYPDPYSRFDHRYWDGRQWTQNVSTKGVATTDSPEATPTPSVPSADPSPIAPTAPSATPAQDPPSVTIHCGQCGVSLRPDVRFCVQCGSPVVA